MNWFIQVDYKNKKSHVGPYSEEKVKDLYHSGQISKESKIWHKGLRAWTSFEEALIDFEKQTEEEIRRDLPPIPILANFDEDITTDCLEYEDKNNISENQKVESAPFENKILEDKKISDQEITKSSFFQKYGHLILRLGYFSLLSLSLFQGVKYLEGRQKWALSKNFNEKEQQGFLQILKTPLVAGHPDYKILWEQETGKIWFATNLKSKGELKITLSSIPGRVLGGGKVIFTARGYLERGVIDFEQFNLKQGSEILVGEYKVQVRGKGEWANKNMLIGFSSINHLEKALSKNRMDLIERDRQKNRGIRESYQTLENLLMQTEKLFNSHVTRRKRVRVAQKKFRQEYLKNVSGILQHITYDHEKFYQFEKTKNLTMAKEYKHIYLQGKELGEIVSEILEGLGDLSKKKTKNKKREISLFIATYRQKFQSLKRKIVHQLQKNQHKFL